MKLEQAKKQCFAYDGLGGCAVLESVATCKGCTFYKTPRKFIEDQEKAERAFKERNGIKEEPHVN